MIIPAIDLMNGKLVSLKQGKKKIIELDNPLDFAKKFSTFSEIQLIDLDSALGRGNNLDLIKKICKITKCRVGGGIRTIKKARELINAGAEKIIIGTKANKEFLSKLCKGVGKERIIVAIDSNGGKVAIKGWKEQTSESPLQKARLLEDYCSEFLYTCIEKEGLMEGADMITVKELLGITKNRITVAGGVSTIREIKKFGKIGADCVVGMAIYTKRLNIEEISRDIMAEKFKLDFEKMNGLVPAIIQDWKTNEILMLGFMNKEAWEKTEKTGKVTFWSRTRNELWTKGEKSGNFLIVKKVYIDCDDDTILIKAEAKGPTCHTGNKTCFFKEVK